VICSIDFIIFKLPAWVDSISRPTMSWHIVGISEPSTNPRKKMQSLIIQQFNCLLELWCRKYLRLLHTIKLPHNTAALSILNRSLLKVAKFVKDKWLLSNLMQKQWYRRFRETSLKNCQVGRKYSKKITKPHRNFIFNFRK
jgi:hypothetical protein